MTIQNFTQWNNADWRYRISIPHQLSGASAYLSVEKRDGSSALKLALGDGLAIVDVGTQTEPGVIEIAAPQTQMETIAPGLYLYDLVVQLADERVNVLSGTIHLRQGVTEWPSILKAVFEAVATMTGQGVQVHKISAGFNDGGQLLAGATQTHMPTAVLQDLADVSFALSADIDMDFPADQALINGISVVVNSLLSCTRATSGWAERVDGSMQEFAVNVLRMTDKGLLVEEARTNLALYSEPPNPTSAIYGGSSGGGATRITVNWLNEFAHAAQIASVAGGTSYTYLSTIFIDVGEYRVSFYARATDGSAISVTTGTTTGDMKLIVSGCSVFTPVMEMVDATLGLYKVTAKIVCNVAVNSAIGGLQYSAQAGKAVQFSGVQFEQATDVSSYIETTGASATRVADQVQFSDLSWLDAEKGTLLIEAEAVPLDSAALIGHDGGNSLLARGVGQAQAKTDNGTTALVATAGSGGFDGVSKLALSWDVTGRSVCFNNGVVASDANLVGAITRMDVGSLLGASAFSNTTFRAIAYWPERKADAELGTITS